MGTILTDMDVHGKVSTSIDMRGGRMSRVQLALNVSDIDEAVAFYSKMFGASPAKRRDGYANFAIAEPPLKLVLIENKGAETRLNHLGVEVSSTDDVVDAHRRFSQADLETSREDGVECCYALQDKVWVSDPDGASWEFYTVLADANTFSKPDSASQDAACCSTAGAGASGCC